MLIISDVHGDFDAYLTIAKTAEYSVQLGDFGFRKAWLRLDGCGLDCAKHKILGGNHDDYATCVDSPYYLGDFGICDLGGTSFFYVRGAHSIDWKYRTEGLDLFQSQEQLGYAKSMKCVELYNKTRPDLVLSHECPASIKSMILNQNVHDPTSTLLQRLLDIRPPKAWYFGHHHMNLERSYLGTKFKCLAPLNWEDI